MWLHRGLDARRLAQLAGAVGLLYAGVSAYWGLGGTWLLDTVSTTFARQARAGSSDLLLAVWAAAALKLLAVALALLAVRPLASRAWARRVRVLAWIAAAALITYGLLLTAGSGLILAGVVDGGPSGHRVTAWHTFLWDPWFLVWGLLLAAALLRSARRDRR